MAVLGAAIGIVRGALRAELPIRGICIRIIRTANVSSVTVVVGIGHEGHTDARGLSRQAAPDGDMSAGEGLRSVTTDSMDRDDQLVGIIKRRMSRRRRRCCRCRSCCSRPLLLPVLLLLSRFVDGNV